MFAFRTPIDAREPAPSSRLRLPLRSIGTADDRESVRLRPDWPALFAMTGYAERATWLFGNRAAVLECVERRPQRCFARCSSDDPASVRLDFLGWRDAAVRHDGATRHLEFFGASGSTIATVRLDEVDRAVDELIWLLMDDSPTAALQSPAPKKPYLDITPVRALLPLLERRADFDRLIASYRLRRGDAFAFAGPTVAELLPRNAVEQILQAAASAGIRVRVRIENAGGSVVWAPALQAVSLGSDYVELRSKYGRMHVARSLGPTWLVRLASTERGGPSIEAASAPDDGWIRLDVADEPQQRDAWRDLCRGLLDDPAYCW